MKKNLNCGGDPNTEQTELGAMCPAACAGYNDCQVTESGEIRKVEPAPIKEDLVDGTEGVEDIADGDFTRQQNLTLKMQNSECKDEDGMWLNHMGKYRQCRWFFTNEFEVEEKKRMNCGITGTLLATIKLNFYCNFYSHASLIVTGETQRLDKDVRELAVPRLKAPCQG